MPGNTETTEEIDRPEPDEDGAEAVDTPDSPDDAPEGGEATSEPEAAADEGELIVSFGEDAPQDGVETFEDEDAGQVTGLDQHQAAGFFRLRRKAKTLKEELARKDAEIALLRGGSAPPEDETEGPEPVLEEFADAAAITKFREDLSAWHAKKARIADRQKEREAARDRDRRVWEGIHGQYERQKAVIVKRAPAFTEAEDRVKDSLSVVQQGIIMKAAKDKAPLMVLGLGTNPKRLQELAKITDPVEFTWAAAQLEASMKKDPKRTAPPPERRLSSAVPGAAAIDNTLEKLRAEADRTGDRSKVAAHIAQKAKAA